MTPLALLVLLATPAVPVTEPAAVGRGNCVIFHSTTELQRVVFDRGKPVDSFYVLVNGGAALQEDGSINPKAIDLENLTKALKDATRFRDREKKVQISIAIAYSDRRPSEEAKRLLYFALIGVAAEVRADDGGVCSILGDDDWQRAVETLKAHGVPKEKEPEENAVGDTLAKAYPVRTAYSRMLTRNADCVVEVVDPFDKASNGQLTAEQEKAVAAAVADLQLARKEALRIAVKQRFGAGGIEKFCDEGAPALAKRLGFKKVSVFVYGVE